MKELQQKKASAGGKANQQQQGQCPFEVCDSRIFSSRGVGSARAYRPGKTQDSARSQWGGETACRRGPCAVLRHVPVQPHLAAGCPRKKPKEP